MMRSILLVGVTAIGASLATGAAADSVASIHNGTVKVVAVKDGDRVYEQYFAREGNKWIQLLQSGNPARPDPDVKLVSGPMTSGFQLASRSVNGDQQNLVFIALWNRRQVTRTVSIDGESPFVHVSTVMTSPDSVSMDHFLATYSFVPDGRPYKSYQPLDFVFAPNLRPQPDEIIGDHVFRSPALMMQTGSRFAAVVPDVRTIDGAARPIRAIADIQVEASSMPLMTFGLMNWIRKGHVYYAAADTIPGRVLSDGFGYYIYVTATAEPRKGFQDVVRFLWSTVGHAEFLKAKGPQAEPFASYIHKAWYEFVPRVALNVKYEGKDVTLLRQARLAWSNNLPKAADNDNWFNVWFNSLRTAYGMEFYAQETGDDSLSREAVGNLNLELLAPRHDGIAPSIFYVDSLGGHWVADQAWGGIDSGRCYAMFHNAWTDYWLLQWIDLQPDRKEEILKVTGAFGGFLMDHQEASGVIPSWYQPGTLEPAPQLRDENAETAGAALFLAELYRRTGTRKYLEAAERAMEYILKDILPERKWFDYETFFSCSRKPLTLFDSYTGQFPQNTLSMHQAAEACYELYWLTGNSLYKEHGTEIMDYLCLYQQVWSPEWLSCPLFGGFGVQNTDGEWSDSRQGYFAVTLMHYYELTGREEYFERGVAALRAMFSLFESPDSPRTAENYAHGATDRLAGVTGLHWGTGSSVVSIHLIRKFYGDAYVNVRDQWGAGIDGCRIPSVKVAGSTVTVALLNNLTASRSVRLTFDRCPEREYTIIVNGAAVGTFPTEKLRKGIKVTI